VTVLNRVLRGETYTGDTQLEIEECGVCGVLFGAPHHLLERARRNHSIEFFCPNGQQLHYLGKTEAEKLQERLEAERRYSARIVSQLDQTQASLSATKGVVTKLKKRAVAGVCPCCNRHFPQLADHMAVKHPEFVDAEALIEEAPEPNRAAHRARADALLSLLSESDRRFMEIVQTLDISKGHANVLLHRMVANGEIVRVSRGLYRKAG